jgi:prenylcysteine oxidase / farnesylcysteine lyase
MHKLTLLAFIAAPLCRAFQFPFDISNVWSTKHQFPLSPDVVPPRSPRIAIIGAGAGGSSAAFWIAKAKERYGLDIAIDLYERSDYIGGSKLYHSCDLFRIRG